MKIPNSDALPSSVIRQTGLRPVDRVSHATLPKGDEIFSLKDLSVEVTGFATNGDSALNAFTVTRGCCGTPLFSCKV